MGYVEIQNDQVLVSTCMMHTYKFPFDTQMCNLSFKSVIHTGERGRFLPQRGSPDVKTVTPRFAPQPKTSG